MNLTRFPRKRYTPFATPIEKLEGLTGMYGKNIYIKRDDMLGLTGGGNKTRKLEFLIADAIARGADEVITCGAVQSNHCRLTLSACGKENLRCHLVLEERVPGSYNKGANGNNLLFNLIGAASVTIVPGGSDMLAEMQKVADSIAARGGKPYIIPGGGSNEIGALGYVNCALETMAQLADMHIKMDAIICTSGSGGTHAGLLTGLVAMNTGIPVVGISISRKAPAQRELVYNLCKKTADFLGLRGAPSMDDVIVFDEYVGEGYSRPTDGMKTAVKTLAQIDGILLDPVYTGKTMDGMMDLLFKHYFFNAYNILFLHTGGSPAVYAYMNDLL